MDNNLVCIATEVTLTLAMIKKETKIKREKCHSITR